MPLSATRLDEIRQTLPVAFHWSIRKMTRGRLATAAAILVPLACGSDRLLDPGLEGVRYRLVAAADSSLPIRLEPGTIDFEHGRWHAYLMAAELLLTPTDSAVLAVRLHLFGERIDSLQTITHRYEVSRAADSLRLCQEHRRNIGAGQLCLGGSIAPDQATVELRGLFFGPPGSGLKYLYRRQ